MYRNPWKRLARKKHLKKLMDLLALETFRERIYICFLLSLDIVEWFSCNSTTHNMIYGEDVVQFWQIGYRLFRGNFLRFMSGTRNVGHAGLKWDI